MPLLEELPANVEKTLRASRNGTGDEPLTLVVKTDIAPDGQIGDRWIVVDAHMVRVLSENGDGGAAHLDLAVPLTEIASAKTENLVGGGALTLARGTDAVEVARYTQPLAGRMGSVARTIEALAKGEEPPVADLEGEDERTCPTCGRPLPKDNDVCRFCINKTATLARLFSYAAPYKGQAALLLLLMFSGIATGLVPGIIVRHLTDDVLVPTHPSPTNVRLGLLGMLVGWMIATRILDAALNIYRGRLSAYLSGIITYKLRTDVHGHLQSLGMSYFDKKQSGALMTRVTQDVNELNNFLVDGLQVLVVNGLTLAGILIILLTQNWRLTLLVLLPAPIVVYMTRRAWKFLRGRWQRVWHLRSALSAGLNATLSGARVVKAFAQEDREVDKFNNRSRAMFQANLFVEQTSATIFPAINLVMTAGSLVVWYAGGQNVIAGAITFGTLNMFLFYLGQLYGPLQGMTRIADWLSRALTAAERVFEVLDTEADVKDEADAVSLPRIDGSVEFKNVSFGYDKSRRVLENLDLVIAPGEMIGLVGHSGAGKTTIINLLARFYDPVEGEILIDGVPMNHIKVNDLRRQLGIVLQEPFLFPGSIAENIAYANPAAAPEAIMRAAKAANAHDFIMRFPDGYDTQVGERGVKLSGGERQRLIHRPRRFARPAHPYFGRSDRERGHRNRKANSGSHHAAYQGPHHVRHRAPAVHAPQRRPASGHGQRQVSRTRNPRRTHAKRRRHVPAIGGNANRNQQAAVGKRGHRSRLGRPTRKDR